MSKITERINDATTRAYVALQIFAAQEPVRVRAGVASVVLAAGAWLGLDVSGYLEPTAVVGAVVLPILVGESTRRKVSPTHDQ
ncbi:hypothetical protein OTB20_08410 [Streptomyces sp. H27-H1]|uniref:hypothetical protein n=1 Tax=Streptomyces sp. H27-H1 TaxID=2996461 RepID=UPI00226FEBBC|nr:hypothetical protein [Streptomyces sp. H27-H1]MCY0926227.1 hypothetical protein [Streptomyces sp. H27-H1]